MSQPVDLLLTGGFLLTMNHTFEVIEDGAIAIKDDDTSSSLHDRLADTGGKAIVSALKQRHELHPEVQDNDHATYARRLSKAEGRIDWTLPAAQILRTLRAFTPWPGCFSTINNMTIKIHQAEFAEARSKEDQDKLKLAGPGAVLASTADGIRIACGKDAINITRLQLPGAKALSAPDFVNGNQQLLIPGQQFSNDAN